MIVLRGRHDKRVQPVTRGRILLGVGEEAHGSAAVRFAFEEAERRGAVLEAVRAWRCPAHQTADHPLLAGEPARQHEQGAAETLEAALNEVAAEYPSVEVHRRTAEGQGPPGKVLLEASATADLLVVGARRQQQTFGLQQKPMTCSTPARLYQLRSNSTISPAAGRCSAYRWKYHWVRSRSVGFGSATMRGTRGLRCSATRLLVPPLPAASRPSMTTTRRAPSARTHSCSFTNSVCRRSSSFS